MGEQKEHRPDEPGLTDAEISEGEDIAVPSGDITEAITEAVDDVVDREDGQDGRGGGTKGRRR